MAVRELLDIEETSKVVRRMCPSKWSVMWIVASWIGRGGKCIIPLELHCLLIRYLVPSPLSRVAMWGVRLIPHHSSRVGVVCSVMTASQNLWDLK